MHAFIRKHWINNKYGTEPYFVIAVWGYFLLFWLYGHLEAAGFITSFFLAISPFVLPFLLATLLYHTWFEYVREKKYWKEEYMLLEIRLPEEITQSPYAAELMLRGLYQTGVDSPVDPFFGATLPWFSLEIASDHGRVRFYIWGRRRFKQLVESQIYAHYPTVQVVEVPDYTLQVPYDPAVIVMNGVEQALQKPDPYPILTYVEARLDKPDLKEEFKQDPMASIIEAHGSIKEGEHMWTQFIIRAHEETSFCPYAEATTHEKLNVREWAQKEIDTITTTVKDATGRYNFTALTEGDKSKIQAMQMKLNKQLFEVGIRSMYIAEKDKAVTSPRIMLASAFRSFEHGSEGRGLNGLRPIFWIGPFNFAWHDFMNIRRRMLWKRFYQAYATRQFFFTPHRHLWIVLNSEELATMYHFPGQVVRTPNLERMPSRRAEAPANLPT